MARKRLLPMSSEAIRYAAHMKVVPFVSDQLRMRALVDAFEAGYRYAQRVRRASEKDDAHGKG